jgi:hypothetical protein
MSTRAPAWLAWLLWGLCGALAVLAVLLDFYTPPVPARHGPNYDALAGIPLLVYPTVGRSLSLTAPRILSARSCAAWVSFLRSEPSRQPTPTTRCSHALAWYLAEYSCFG